MRRLALLVTSALAAMLVPAVSADAKSPQQVPNYTLTGSTGAAVLIHPGYKSKTAVQITSTGDGSGGLGTWGAVNVAIPQSMTLSQISNLSTQYMFTLGSCWGGSPRFEAWIPDPSSPLGHDKVFLYIGPTPSYTGCPFGAWTNTGNLATPSSYIDDSQLPGGTSYDTVQHAQQVYGSDPVSAIYLDVDGGWAGTQTIEFDNTQVNRTLVTYEG